MIDQSAVRMQPVGVEKWRKMEDHGRDCREMLNNVEKCRETERVGGI